MNTKHLQHALSSIGKVISRNTVIPILENALFVSEEGVITLTATDLQTTIQIKIAGDIPNINTTIPVGIFLDTIKTLDDIELEFVKDRLVIKSATGVYMIPTSDSKDFPVVPTVDGEYIEIDGDLLISSLSKVSGFTSNDELRQSLTGVLFEFKTDGLALVATDAHRLSFRRIVGDFSERSVIIPTKPIKALVPSISGPIEVKFGDKHAEFKSGNVTVYSRIIDERYPNYEAVIPKDNPIHIEVDRKQLISCVKRVSIFSNSLTRSIVMDIKDGHIYITAEDNDLGNSANEKVKASITGGDIRIGVNSSFMTEVLNNISSEFITMEMSQPNRAVVVTDTEDGLFLLMPVMI